MTAEVHSLPKPRIIYLMHIGGHVCRVCGPTNQVVRVDHTLWCCACYPEKATEALRENIFREPDA